MDWKTVQENAKILIVDDEPSNVLVMERMLQQAGYRGIVGTTNPTEAREIFRSTRPDLVILDLMMPQMDGFEVLEQLQAEVDADDYLPVLVLTADTQNESRLRALLLGAKDFITKPMDRLEALLRVRILLETRFKFRRLLSREKGSGN